MPSKKKTNPDQGVLFEPPSDWIAPTELPDLRNKVNQLAIDTEGRDEGLAFNRGSGWPQGAGFIAGVSLAWREGTEVKAIYVPTQHKDSQCFSQEAMTSWVNDHAAAGIRFITHHGSHDWGWMRTTWGVRCPPALADTEAMASLVDEDRYSYSLENLCRWRGLPGKDERALREAAATFGIDPKSDLWRLPARHVGPYAEQDARATLLLAENLQEEVLAQNLADAVQLEHDLIPAVLEMRLRGIAVDLETAHNNRVHLLRHRDRILTRLARKLGRSSVSIEECRSPQALARMFAAEGIPIEHRTAKTGQPSFQAQWMKKHPHWLPRFVTKAEQLTDAADKFINGFILEYAHHGRIHASINQYRGEEGGARSYRFSYSDPPLQQAPHRDPRMTQIFRGAFQPEPGDFWVSVDMSQQEYRLIVHFAAALNLPKAREIAQLYQDNPDTDFHRVVAEWTGLERKPAKDANFAKAYGAGPQRFAEMIGSSIEHAREVMAQYDTELPFVKALDVECKRLAAERGYLRLLDGARSHFDRWERAHYETGVGYEPPVAKIEALRKWPGQRLRRAFTHKALNRLIQGSAARQTKLWLRGCFQEGYVPLLQLHDELDFSLNQQKDVQRVMEIGRDIVRLRLPMKLDVKIGPNWGAVK